MTKTSILNYKKTQTSKIQNKNNHIIKYLKNKDFINETTAKKLYSTYNGIPIRLYANPKIHKRDLCYRPIVACNGCPTEKLSKFIAKILSNSLHSNQYYVKDSFEFSNLLNNFQIPDNYVLISLDVVSLFTNIPKDLTITVINNN